ncbi:pyrimidine/purine nucleoside phosphorylase [Enterobacteriaceae bacterium LUAb1]
MLSISEYFGGKVKSVSFENTISGRSSVGVIVAGEYTFATTSPEEMTVVSGSFKVLLAGDTEWKWYEAGDKFNIPGHSECYLQLAEPGAYLCRYL